METDNGDLCVILTRNPHIVADKLRFKVGLTFAEILKCCMTEEPTDKVIKLSNMISNI